MNHYQYQTADGGGGTISTIPGTLSQAAVQQQQQQSNVQCNNTGTAVQQFVIGLNGNYHTSNTSHQQQYDPLVQQHGTVDHPITIDDNSSSLQRFHNVASGSNAGGDHQSYTLYSGDSLQLAQPTSMPKPIGQTAAAPTPVATVTIKKPTKSRAKGGGKDSGKPTKPVSAYALFFRDTQPSIKADNPQASFGEISKIVASKWEQLGKGDKDVYKERADVEKRNYLQNVASVKAKEVAEKEQQIAQQNKQTVASQQQLISQNQISSNISVNQQQQQQYLQIKMDPSGQTINSSISVVPTQYVLQSQNSNSGTMTLMVNSSSGAQSNANTNQVSYVNNQHNYIQQPQPSQQQSMFHQVQQPTQQQQQHTGSNITFNPSNNQHNYVQQMDHQVLNHHAEQQEHLVHDPLELGDTTFNFDQGGANFMDLGLELSDFNGDIDTLLNECVSTDGILSSTDDSVFDAAGLVDPTVDYLNDLNVVGTGMNLDDDVEHHHHHHQQQHHHHHHQDPLGTGGIYSTIGVPNAPTTTATLDTIQVDTGGSQNSYSSYINADLGPSRAINQGASSTTSFESSSPSTISSSQTNELKTMGTTDCDGNVQFDQIDRMAVTSKHETPTSTTNNNICSQTPPPPSSSVSALSISSSNLSTTIRNSTNTTTTPMIIKIKLEPPSSTSKIVTASIISSTTCPTTIDRLNNNTNNNNNKYEVSSSFSSSNASTTGTISNNNRNKRQCVRKGCGRLAVDSTQWDGEYCSEDCCVQYCSDIFNNWTSTRDHSTVSNNVSVGSVTSSILSAMMRQESNHNNVMIASASSTTNNSGSSTAASSSMLTQSANFILS
ncbi:hypothetical protein RDWZM_001030 [Blomia tropicalis]|uniref:HMG box domain-containing protein n=1 Tax=Blomia tropicalis TaxID=40697 RepID=A0A9Q0MF85_BLOTA|nr:hypothetical protein RDWZM_001030 [Blomia tropicalis]